MDIREYIHVTILSHIGENRFNRTKLEKGIDTYIADNGFCKLEAAFSDKVIENVIKNNLGYLLSGSQETTILFFSNYENIEKIRLLNNESLEMAKRAEETNFQIESERVSELEDRFEKLLKEIYCEEGLSNMLKTQISEIILNLDYAKKISPYYSKKMRDMRQNYEQC